MPHCKSCAIRIHLHNYSVFHLNSYVIRKLYMTDEGWNTNHTLINYGSLILELFTLHCIWVIHYYTNYFH